MADDTYSRGWRGDQDRGRAGDSGSAPDPLTELARLIGQSDPFGGDRTRAPDQHHSSRPVDWPTGAAHEAHPYDPAAHADDYAAGSEPPPYADETHGSGDPYPAGYADPHGATHEAGYGHAPGYVERARVCAEPR